MDLAPWKLMLGLAVILIIIGLVAQIGDLGPVDILIGILFAGSILAAMYVGWRIGQGFAN